jgi:hypothetical protein
LVMSEKVRSKEKSSLLCEANSKDLFSPCCMEADLLPQG